MSEVYYPQTIEDQALGSVIPATGHNSGEPGSSGQSVQTPTTVTDTQFTPTVIARETVSESLDTRTKRIKSDFEFSNHGSIKIGSYEFGVSGEVVLTPNGIAATNINGEQTFGIDATTGDATFKGIVQAGSFIAGDGDVVVEGDENGGRIVIYNSGIPAIVLGEVT